MVALAALLATQCLVTLVALPPSAAAIAVRWPHSNCKAVHHHPIQIPAPRKGKGHHSSGGGHISNAMLKEHGKRGPLGSSPYKEGRDITPRSAANGLGTQKTFQTRSSEPISDLIPKKVNDALGRLLGQLSSLKARHYSENAHIHNHSSRPETTVIDSKRVRIKERTLLKDASSNSTTMERHDQACEKGMITMLSKDKNLGSMHVEDAENGVQQLKVSPDRGSLVEMCYLTAPSPDSKVSDSRTAIFKLLGNLCITFAQNTSSPTPMTVTNCSEFPGQKFSVNSYTGRIQPMSIPMPGEAATPALNPSGGESNCTERRDSALSDVTLVFHGLTEDEATEVLASSPPMTTVTVTTTVTPEESSSVPIAAADATPTTTSNVSTSTSLSSGPQPGVFDVEVAQPSTTSSAAITSEASSSTASAASLMFQAHQETQSNSTLIVSSTAPPRI